MGAVASVEKVKIPYVSPILSYRLMTAQHGSDDVTGVFVLMEDGGLMVHDLAVSCVAASSKPTAKGPIAC